MSAIFKLRIIGALLFLLSVVACGKLEDLKLALEDKEGGIIGTGIVGTITGIGSIYVNGIHVIYDDDLKVKTAFGNESPKQLIPGDTVSVEAIPDGAVFKATSIERYRPIIAPIEAIADDRSWLEVLGVRVLINEATRIIMERRSEEIDRDDLPVGAWVAVSGIWRDDHVVASGIRWISAKRTASVRGVLERTAEGSLQIGGVRLTNAKGLAGKIGRMVAARGTITRDRAETSLVVHHVAAKRFSAKIQRLFVEGFTSTPTPDGAYTIYGSGLTSFTDDPSMSMPDSRSMFCGVLNGSFDIENTIGLPEDRAQREALSLTSCHSQ
ncbi:MAG: DUF5666 domain-containing protein [Geminicoccaceae bacterium]